MLGLTCNWGWRGCDPKGKW